MKASYERDLTQGSLARNIWGLSWPITISQMLFMLPSVYDAVWLGGWALVHRRPPGSPCQYGSQ